MEEPSCGLVLFHLQMPVLVLWWFCGSCCKHAFQQADSHFNAKGPNSSLKETPVGPDSISQICQQQI